LLPNLVPTDWLILLLSLFCVFAIGVSLRGNIKTSRDFFQAGRALPGWVCAVAFIAVGLGWQEVIAMGAAGARYGFRTALYFSLGAVPAMLFAGLYMMPLYYGSGARTTPEYLRLRFDQKTRLLQAGVFALATILSGGISLFLMARLFQALHIFDPLFYGYGWPRQGIFLFCVVLSAGAVLVYVLLAGLAGTMVNQVVQFLLIVAAFFPVALMGMKNIGGWSGLKALVPVGVPQGTGGLAGAGALGTAGVGLLLGVVFSACRWTTDFRILQAAMAAKDLPTARRIPLVAAAVRLLLPFLLILPGAIAIGLPTPHNQTVVRDENGAIYHEITVVPPEDAEGRGVVPARLDAATGASEHVGGGGPVLNYDRAAPNMLMHFLPTGLLGLGVAALLASLMSGLAAGVMALSAVFAIDIYPSRSGKEGGDAHLLTVGRWAVVGGILLSIGVAYGCSVLKIGLDNILYPLLLCACLVGAPQLATFLLGMFTRRTTGHGAFAGLAAGSVAALLHYGLTLPRGAAPGYYGGWIAVVHRYPGLLAQYFWTAAVGFAVNLVVAVAVSSGGRARPEKELKGLVHSVTQGAARQVWWKRAEAMAAAVLIGAIVLGLWFA
jgi:SSS family solute:Na+ symporter